jgi:hypothetical protein
MKLRQLLGRQGRAKIGVALTHNGQHGLPEHQTRARLLGPPRWREIRPSAPLSPEGLQQSVDLSSADANQPRGVCDR